MKNLWSIAALAVIGCGGGGGRTPGPVGSAAIPKVMIRWPFLHRDLSVPVAGRAVTVTVEAGGFTARGTQVRPTIDDEAVRPMVLDRRVSLGSVTVKTTVYGTPDATGNPYASSEVTATLGVDGTMTMTDGKPLAIAPEGRATNFRVVQPDYTIHGQQVKFGIIATDANGAVIPTSPDYGRWRMQFDGDTVAPDGSWTANGWDRVRWEPDPAVSQSVVVGELIPSFSAGKIVRAVPRSTPFERGTKVFWVENRIVNPATGEYRQIEYPGLGPVSSEGLIRFRLGDGFRVIDVYEEREKEPIKLPENCVSTVLELPDGSGFAYVKTSPYAYQYSLVATDLAYRVRATLSLDSGYPDGFARSGATFFLTKRYAGVRAIRWTGSEFENAGFVPSQGDFPIKGSDGNVTLIEQALYGEDPSRPIRQLGPESSIFWLGLDGLLYERDPSRSEKLVVRNPLSGNPYVFSEGTAMVPRWAYSGIAKFDIGSIAYYWDYSALLPPSSTRMARDTVRP